MTNDPIVMYMHYTEELDTLTCEQVDWEPYGSFYRIGAAMTDLNPKCTEESAFWLNNAYDEDILDEPIAFDEVAQNQYDRIARAGRSTSIASSVNFVIPDDTILGQAKEQGAQSAYMLKHWGKAPNRYTPKDYANRGKKAIVESDEEPSKRSALRRMRNDEPFSSEEEVEEEASPPPPWRKQPARRGRRS
nr:uncharacterized protein LOC127315759 [Lolium perenne]